MRALIYHKGQHEYSIENATLEKIKQDFAEVRRYNEEEKLPIQIQEIILTCDCGARDTELLTESDVMNDYREFAGWLQGCDCEFDDDVDLKIKERRLVGNGL